MIEQVYVDVQVSHLAAFVIRIQANPTFPFLALVVSFTLT